MTPDDNTPLEDFAKWIQSDTRDPDERMTGGRMDDLTDRAIAEGRHRRAQVLRRSRRRRVATGIGVAVALTAGTAVAASVILREQPTAPQAGTVCRAKADLVADAIVVDPGRNPIALCQNLWDDGAFEEYGVDAPPEELVACISDSGTVDVFPGTGGLCVELGLALADTDVNPESQKLVALQQRLVDEINTVDCATADQAAVSARQILDDLKLTEWAVQVNPDAAGADCAKAGIGPDNHHVYIHKL